MKVTSCPVTSELLVRPGQQINLRWSGWSSLTGHKWGTLSGHRGTTRRFRSMGPSHGSKFRPSFPKEAKPTRCRGWKQKPSLARLLLRNTGKRSSWSGLTPSWRKTRKSRFGTRLAFTSSPFPGQKKFCKGSHHEKIHPHSRRTFLGCQCICTVKWCSFVNQACRRRNHRSGRSRPDIHSTINPAISSGC